VVVILRVLPVRREQEVMCLNRVSKGNIPKSISLVLNAIPHLYVFLPVPGVVASIIEI
jgi:hypothetical protein